METLLFGSASALRLMLTVSSAAAAAAAAAAAQSIKFFLVEWYFPKVRLWLQWKSECRLNLREEDVPRWGLVDEEDGGEVSEDLEEEEEVAQVLRERIIHKGGREKEKGKERKQ